MSDMRLMVAGAGGRMGRTLIKAIAESKGLKLAGAVEDARSPLIGRDAGVLAGPRRKSRQADRRSAKILEQVDGIIDFTAPAATVALCRARRQGRQGAHHRHHRADGG